MVTADETGWRVGARSHWLWTAVTPTTVYALCAGRGFDDAQTLLGADFDGVLVRDGWAVYRGFTHGEHQSCLQHLRRRCEHLRDNHPRSPWAGHVQDTLQAGLALRDRRNARGISDHGLATARGQLLARLSRLIDNPPRLDVESTTGAVVVGAGGSCCRRLSPMPVPHSGYSAEVEHRSRRT